MYQNLLKGNLVYGTGKFEGVALEVLEISDSSVSLGNENGIIQTCDISEIKPIVIDFEWLQKLGFFCTKVSLIFTGWYFHIGRKIDDVEDIYLNCYFYENGDFEVLNFHKVEKMEMLKFSHIHELQNCFLDKYEYKLKLKSKLDLC